MVRRGLSPDEWDALPIRDQEALSWWQYVQSTGFRAMSDEDFKRIPIKGGARTAAFRQYQEARQSLYPPDED